MSNFIDSLNNKLKDIFYTISSYPDDVESGRKDETFLTLKCINCSKECEKTLKTINSSIRKDIKCRCYMVLERQKSKCPEGCVVINLIDNKYSRYLGLQDIKPYYYVNPDGEIYSTGNGKLSRKGVAKGNDGYIREFFQNKNSVNVK